MDPITERVRDMYMRYPFPSRVVKRTPDFAIAEPPFPCNEGNIRHRVRYWPSSCVRR